MGLIQLSLGLGQLCRLFYLLYSLSNLFFVCPTRLAFRCPPRFFCGCWSPRLLSRSPLRTVENDCLWRLSRLTAMFFKLAHNVLRPDFRAGLKQPTLNRAQNL